VELEYILPESGTYEISLSENRVSFGEFGYAISFGEECLYLDSGFEVDNPMIEFVRN